MQHKKKTKDYLLGQGCDTNLADYLSRQFSLEDLQNKSLPDLAALGLRAAVTADIKNSRPPIPPAILDAVLQKNMRLCCVCYDEKRSVILHHIKPYATEKKHEESNLCVLCLQCHGKAHTKHEMEQNLDEDRLFMQKKSWEAAVAHRKVWVLYSAQSRHTTCRWEWVNLKQLEFLVRTIGIDLGETEERTALEQDGYIAANGYQFLGLDRATNPGRGYITNIGQQQSTLAVYIMQLVERVADQVPVLDVTEYCDKPDLLRGLLKTGMYLCARVDVQVDTVDGRLHAIGRNSKSTLLFEIDDWNFTSSSSRNIYTKGQTTSLVCFGTVRSVVVDPYTGNICITLSALGLSTRFTPNDYFAVGYFE